MVVYAVALYSGGQRDEAMIVFKKALAAHPNDRDTLSALLSYLRDRGDISGALAYVSQLAQLSPNNSRLQALIKILKRQLEKTNAN